MERAIARRESFVLRGLLKNSQANAKAKANTQAQVKKNMADLSKRSKQLKHEIFVAEESNCLFAYPDYFFLLLMFIALAIQNLSSSTREVETEVESAKAEHASMTSKSETLERILEEEAAEKQMVLLFSITFGANTYDK